MLPAIIVALVFGSGLLFIKMILDYNREKLLAKSNGPSSQSLLVSELEDMIHDAVADAVAPLEQRVTDLERKALPPGGAQRSLVEATSSATGSSPSDAESDAS